MDAPLDGERLQQRFDDSESLHEFLAAVDEDASDEIDTIHISEGDDGEGSVVLLGGVHGGRRTREAVTRVIQWRDPDHVAVELGPIQYRLVQHLKPPSSTLELSTALYEAGRVGAETHAIDKSRVWMRSMEAIHGSGEVRAGALLSLAKRAAALALPLAATGLFAAGMTTTGVICLLAALVALGLRIHEYRRDPKRQFDYALIAIITNASATDRNSPRHLVTDRRDEHMAERIARLREDGEDVVAVVGFNHLTGIRQHLDADDWQTTNFDLE